MFDNVDFEMDCPKCGKDVKGFQTKDGNGHCDTVQPHEVDYFYSYCPECDLWFDIKKVTTGHYHRIVRDFGKPETNKFRRDEYDCYINISSPENAIKEAIDLLKWYSSDVPMFANIHSRNSINAEAKDVIMRLKKDV